MSEPETEWIDDAFRANWGSKTVAEIVHEFAVIRGDLVVQSGRDALTRIMEWKVREALPPTPTHFTMGCCGVELGTEHGAGCYARRKA